MHQRKQMTVWLLVMGILLLSCQLPNLLLNDGSSDPLSEYDIDRATAVVLSSGQPRTLDPATTLGGPSGALGHIFSGLVTLDQNLQVQPDLAAGWQISNDGLEVTFFLHQNAIFHNGRPVTAHDVVFSWERAASPQTESDTVLTYLGDVEGVTAVHAGNASTISGLQVIDDHTLLVRLTDPVVYFLQKLAYPVAFVVDRENVIQGDWEHQANGTGPFRLVEWQDDEVLILAKNDTYYRQPAQINHLVFLLGRNLPLALYEQDKIDLVGINGDTLTRLQDANDPLSGDVYTAASLCTSTIGMNNRLAPFDNAAVRQAFVHALDREKLVNIFWDDAGLLAAGALPPGMPGYGAVTDPLPFAVDEARALLATAGYPDPAELGTLTYYTSGFDEVNPLVTAVISMWQENLGVSIEPVLLDPFTFNDELYAGNIGHFFAGGWCADYPDPQNFLDILYHSESAQNLSGFSDSEVDRLLEAARVETDIRIRLDLYAQAERQITTQTPVIFLAHGISSVLVNPRLQNYVLTPMGVRQWHLVSLNE